MAKGFLAGLTKLASTAAALIEHVNFANALAKEQGQASEALIRDYVVGLSAVSYAGLKLTIVGLAKKEQDPSRKATLARLVTQIEAARGVGSMPEPSDPGFDACAAMVGGWYDNLTPVERDQALSAHVKSLSPKAYETFVSHVGEMIANAEKHLAAHKANESRAWGGFQEDRISYMMAKLQTGQSDPVWRQKLQSYEQAVAYFKGVKTKSQKVHEQDQQQQNVKAQRKLSNDEASAILEGLREFTRTGVYPRGVAQQQVDLMAMIEAGWHQQVKEILNSAGSLETDGTKLNAADFYVPAPGSYELRWPLHVPLPGSMKFSEYPRREQFLILFADWTTCEAEALSWLFRGESGHAKELLDECLARAEQLGVAELVARSHEGLAKLAEKSNDRQSQRQHLNSAIKAREAG